MTERAPSSSAAPPRPLRDSPRPFPTSSKVAVLLKGPLLFVAALMVAMGAPLCGGALGEGGGRTLFFENQDVPATVLASDPFTVKGKHSSHTEWRVRARADFMGAPLEASADLVRDPGVGATVQLRVPKRRPDLAIPFVGAAPRDRYLWLFGLAMTGVGALVLAGALLGNRRDLRVLLHGTLTRGTLVEKVPIAVKHGTNWRLTFTYPIERGESARATFTVPVSDMMRMTDEREEWLVYDPARPTTCVVLDALPDHVRADEAGHLTPIPAERAVYRALPLAVVIVAVIAGLLLSRLFG